MTGKETSQQQAETNQPKQQVNTSAQQQTQNPSAQQQTQNSTLTNIDEDSELTLQILENQTRANKNLTNKIVIQESKFQTQDNKMSLLEKQNKLLAQKLADLESQMTKPTLPSSTTDDMLAKILDTKLNTSRSYGRPQSNYAQTLTTGNKLNDINEDEEPNSGNFQPEYTGFPPNSMNRTRTIQSLHEGYDDYEAQHHNQQQDQQPQYQQQQYQQQQYQQPQYDQRPERPFQPKFIKQTEFQGKENEDLEDWIFTMEMNFRLNRVPEDLKIPFAQFYLKDNALGEFKNILKTSIQDGTHLIWSNLLTMFRGRFRPINYEAKQYIKLVSTKQLQGQTVRNFIDTFKSNLSQGLPMLPIQRVAIFVHSLLPDIQAFVASQNPANLDEAIIKALAFEDAQVAVRKSGNGSGSNDLANSINYIKDGNTSFFCFYCGKEGHYQNRCTRFYNDKKQDIYRPINKSTNNVPRNNSNRSFNNERNYRSNSSSNNNSYNKQANRSNNYINNYRSNNNSNNRQQSKPNINRNRQPTTHRETGQNVNQNGRAIKNTGKPRYQEDEPMDTNLIKKVQRHINLVCSNKPNSLIEIDCSADGRNTRAIVDTGSVCSCISEQTCNELGIKFNPSKRSIRVASGNVCPVKGETPLLNLQVNRNISKVKFLVIPANHITMILGLDWIRQADVTIKGGQNTIQVGNETVNTFQNYSSDEDDIMLINMMQLDQKDLEEDDFSDDDYNLSSKEFKPPILENQTPKVQQEFTKIINQFKDIFAFDLMDLKEPCRVETFHIDTLSEKPLVTRPYKRAIREHDEIDTEIQKLLKAGFIRPSNSPWSSEVIIVKKTGKPNRLCFNYKPLNAITIKDNFPIPRIDEIKENLRDSVLFTSLDGTKCYNQFEIDKGSRAKAAFSTKNGHWEPNRVLFGLSNAPCLLARAMKKIFCELFPFVKWYFDDILIHSKDITQHLKHILAVLRKLREFNLKINPSKCKFFKTTIDILGVTISNNVIMMDRKKVQAILDWKEPTNVKLLESFLGYAGYQRKFIKNYASITAPLEALKSKDIKFKWTENCQQSFDFLKKKIASYPILRQPDMTRPFYVMCDCSNNAVGVSLCQYDDNGNEYHVDNESKELKGAARHYGISEKECYGVVIGVTKFRPYLYGGKNYVVVDHKALLWLVTYRDKNPKLMRWSIILQGYDLEYIYRPGKHHGNADGLSRAVYSITFSASTDSNIERFEEETNSKSLDPHEDENLLQFLKTGKFLQGTSKKICKRITKQSEYYVFAEDTLWHRESADSTELKIVPKPEDRKEVIKKHHSFGHFGPQGTYDYVKEKYYWPNMLDQITHEYKRCLQCLKNPLGPGKLSHPAIAIPITGVFDMIGIDSMEGFPNIDGYHCCITIKDHASKLIMVEPTKSKSAEEAANVLWRWICTYGPPKRLMSDQGRQFVNDIFGNILSKFCIQHKVTSPYHPETNGQTEIINKIVHNALTKLIEENPNDWPKLVPFIVLAYNNKVNVVTKYSPFIIVFGKPPNRFEDWRSAPGEDEASALVARAIEIRNMHENIRPQALKNIEKAQVQQKKSQDNRNKQIIPDKLEIGTTVMLRTEGMNPKLTQKYTGPYTIVDIGKLGTYQLKDFNDKVLDKYYNINRLRIIDSNDSDEEIDITQSRDDAVDSNQPGVVDTNLPRTSRSLQPDTQPFNTENVPKKSSISVRKKKDIQALPSVLIERIKGHKKVGNKFLYLVKWEGYPEEENEWLEAKAFDSKNTINDYWFSQPYDLRKPQKTRFNPTNLLSILLFLLQINFGLCFQVTGQFKYCRINDNSPFVDIYDSCHTFETHASNTNTKISILEKRTYAIEGQGHECFKSKITTQTRETMWGNHITYRNIETVRISGDECNIMIQYKRCGRNKMSCAGDMCEFTEEPKLVWSYWQELSFKTFRCVIRKRLLVAKDINTPLFRSKPTYTANKFFCELDSSTVIWTNEIRHPCPYNLVLETNLNISNQIAISESQSLFLQLTNSIHDPTCNITVTGTTEGLYITKDKIPPNLTKSNLDLNVKTHLTLSDSDYKNYNLFTIIAKLNKADNERICELNKQLLRLYEKRTNQFFIIKDKSLKPLVVYNLEGEILETTCIDVKTIIIHELTSECYENAKVSIVSDKRLTTAYLGQDGILSEYKITRNCNTNKRILLPNSKSYIRLVNKKVYRSQLNNEVSITFHDQIKKLNLQHINQIVEDFDLTNVKEETEFENTNIKTLHIEGLKNKPNEQLRQIIKYVEDKYKTVKTIIIVLIIIIGLITITIASIKIFYFVRPSIPFNSASNVNTDTFYDNTTERVAFIPDTNQEAEPRPLFPILKSNNRPIYRSQSVNDLKTKKVRLQELLKQEQQNDNNLNQV